MMNLCCSISSLKLADLEFELHIFMLTMNICHIITKYSLEKGLALYSLVLGEGPRSFQTTSKSRSFKVICRLRTPKIQPNKARARWLPLFLPVLRIAFAELLSETNIDLLKQVQPGADSLQLKEYLVRRPVGLREKKGKGAWSTWIVRHPKMNEHLLAKFFFLHF